MTLARRSARRAWHISATMGGWKHDARQRRSFARLPAAPDGDRRRRPAAPACSPPWLIVPSCSGSARVQQRALGRGTRTDLLQRVPRRAVEEGRIDPETTVKISDSGISGALTTDEGTQDFTTTLVAQLHDDRPSSPTSCDENGVDVQVRAAERARCRSS